MKPFIREWRLHQGKTQSELGFACGVTKGEISRLENGFRRMTIEWINRISAGLGITAEQLLAKPPMNGTHNFSSEPSVEFGPGGVPLTTSSPKTMMIPAIGDEMAPTIPTGDVVVIDTTRKSPTPPGVFAIKEGDATVLRRLQAMGDVVRVGCDNPAYAPYETTLEAIDVVGRMTYLIKRV
jgi:DNA-binding XRE family transcriptional regulator